jgi:hypothetical protein
MTNPVAARRIEEQGEPDRSIGDAAVDPRCTQRFGAALLRTERARLVERTGAKNVMRDDRDRSDVRTRDPLQCRCSRRRFELAPQRRDQREQARELFDRIRSFDDRREHQRDPRLALLIELVPLALSTTEHGQNGLFDQAAPHHSDESDVDARACVR